MDKLHLAPYSFRGKLLSYLYIGAIISCVITFIFAYCVTHLSVQNEVTLQQQAAAGGCCGHDRRAGEQQAKALRLAEEVKAAHLQADGQAVNAGAEDRRAQGAQQHRGT